VSGIVLAQNVVAATPPTPYYFNASRWVWTGKGDVEITLDNIRGYDREISTLKIVRIAILCIPAFLYDLIRMGVSRCMGSREVRPIVAPPLPVQQQALVPYVDPPTGPQERLDFLLNTVRIPEVILPIIMAYLPRERDVTLLNPEPSLRTIFPISEEMYHLVDIQRDISWKFWLEIRSKKEFSPSAIEGFNFLDFKGTNEEFLAAIDQFPNLKRLFPPELTNDRDATWVKAIQKLQNSLEEFRYITVLEPLPSASVIEALRECPHLTGLSLTKHLPHNQHAFPSQAMIALARKGQLKKLVLSMRNLQIGTLREFFRHCPLQHVNVSFDIGRAIDLPPDLFRELVLVSGNRPREQRLLNLSYRFDNLEDIWLRELPSCCPDLETLDVPVSYHQGSLFAELLPQWKELKSFTFDNMSNAQILTAVRGSSSLQMLRLHCSGSYDSATLEVVEELAKLDRPLVLNIGWQESNPILGLTEQQKTRLTERLKPYPHIRIIKTQEEADSFTRESSYEG
jgi:hypothetical protein